MADGLKLTPIDMDLPAFTYRTNLFEGREIFEKELIMRGTCSVRRQYNYGGETT
jgi:hypothetical protein